MAGFESTSLWQSTLAKQLVSDNTETEREFFRVNYEQFRENAGLLAAEISRDLPDYTVHDVTHLDALWEMASIICGKDYELNPAEAFVLGGAFLIHDLGMGVAAYPSGVSALRQTSLWGDTVAFLRKQGKTDQEIEKQATEIVLRALHAKHAEQLALVSWGDEEKYYLIENQKLRESYGPIIGMIAHSHWWNSNELTKRIPAQLGALGDMPNSWGVDAVKLACIMRVADAAHIDSRRAPAILKAFRRPNEYARQHWLFQQRLYQPRLESERLVYTSKSSFTASEARSWWLCFDTLNMIDKELRDADSILGESKRERFQAKGVAAINDVRSLVRLISVDGWYPVDTKIHVGDVARLVKNLGGEQLYGRNYLVPLRELIQNSCDAIRARRIIEDEPEDWGCVAVRVGKDEFGNFVEVEDNGVGMSAEVLAGPFLDFGTSFWGTSMMHSEFPGLESKGFKSTGKYGVGFFSAFMWGEKVCVTTRRFEAARQDTKVLSFERGLAERPILRDAVEGEYIKAGGTRVRVYFSNYSSFEGIFKKPGEGRLELHQVLEDLCPCLDVNLKSEDLIGRKFNSVIDAGDWKVIEGEPLVRRSLGCRVFGKLSEEDKNKLISQAHNVRNVVLDGEVIGRGFISSALLSQRFHGSGVQGVVSVGGFRTSGLNTIIGFFEGEASRASRDIGLPLPRGKLLEEWADEQARLVSRDVSPATSKTIASIIRAVGGYPAFSVVAKHSSGYVTPADIERLITDIAGEIIVISDSSVGLIERDKGGTVELLGNVFVTDPGYPGVLITQSYSEDFWPEHREWFHSCTLKGLLVEIFARVRGVSLDEVKKTSDFSGDKEKYKRLVGYVGGEEVVMSVDILRV